MKDHLIYDSYDDELAVELGAVVNVLDDLMCRSGGCFDWRYELQVGERVMSVFQVFTVFRLCNGFLSWDIFKLVEQKFVAAAFFDFFCISRMIPLRM